MSRRALIITALIVSLLAALAVSQEARRSRRIPSPTGVNLHGKAYMGFVDLSDKPKLAPRIAATTDAFLPTYIVFGQTDNVLYGAIVIPSENEENSAPAEATDIILAEYAIIEGNVNGNNITFSVDEIEDLDLDGPVSGTVQDSGNKIGLYINYPILGKVHLVDLFLCNQTDTISGQYLGTAQTTVSSPPVVHNAMIGVLIQGTKANFTAFIYDPDEPDKPYTLTGEGQYNPNNGRFTFDGNAAREEPDVEGTLKNGIANLTMNFPNGIVATAKLYFFDDTRQKNPKLKKPKPKKAKRNQSTELQIKHRFGLMGSLIGFADGSGAPSAPAAMGVRITRYEYYPKYYKVWVDVAEDAAKGKYTLTITGPNGKTAKAKKPLKVK